MNKALNELRPGERGAVTKLNGSGALRRRLVDMGIVPGTVVCVHKLAPLGDPIEIKVKQFNLSLRKQEAALIEVLEDKHDNE